MNPRRVRLLLALGLGALLLAGCASSWRERADTHLRAGNYESALRELQDGLRRHPDSASLRAGLIAAQADAVTHLLALAVRQRDAGRPDEADRSLERALALAPRDERALALRADIARQRRAPRAQRIDDGPVPLRALAETRPIALDFRNAPLSAVLEAITRGSGVNFILDREVRQDTRVTVYLRAARVEDAIDLVTGAHQLTRRIVDAHTVLVYPNTPEKQREHQEQVIRVFHLAHAQAKTTAAMLRSLLRLKEPFVDERANLVALREPAEIIAVAERLVALHDVADAEVMLEVEVLEITTSRLNELGIRVPDALTLTPLSASGPLTVQGLAGLNASAIGVGVGGLTLNLKRETGDVNILANPRIRTRNREKARILIGDKVPVITTTASATGFVSESVSYLDVGLKLEVEPTVSPDDEVSIRLGLEVSSIAREVRGGSGTLAYQLGTRNANTTLRLRDGETQLLAGLINHEDRNTANRIPGLGDLPLAGRLFSSQRDDHRRTELVLAITPRVLRPAPRPDLAQTRLSVGTELTTRLGPPEGGDRPPDDVTPGAAAPATPASAGPSTPSPAATPSAPPAADAAPAGDGVPAALTAPRLFWSAPAGARVGDSFVVTLGMESATQLRGAPMELAYTSAQLELLDVQEGDLLRQGGAATSFTHAVDPGAGRVTVGLLRSDGADRDGVVSSVGASGRGALVRLRFRARAAGEGEVRLVSLRPIGQGVPVAGAAPAEPLAPPPLKLQLR
ncbi:MAG: tetratricopeptide repeat protein [Pseudomonadota bacterium]